MKFSDQVNASGRRSSLAAGSVEFWDYELYRRPQTTPLPLIFLFID
jgi:hypothetical protein